MERPSENGVESLSIEETNALRLKLGLKPLAVQDSSTKSSANESQATTKTVTADDENEEFQNARRSLIQGGSIADMLKRGEKLRAPGTTGDDDDEEESTQLDVKAWSRKMATIAARNRISALSYSDDEAESQAPAPSKPKPPSKRDRAKLKVLHKVDDLGLESGKAVVLTLADVGILEAEAAGVADVSFLENPEKPSKATGKLKASSGLDYDPYGEDEDDMVDGKPDILRKYDKAIDEYKGTKLNNLATGKQGFYLNVDEETEPGTKKAATMLTRPTEESLNFGGIQRKKDLLKNRQKPVNWDKVFKSSTSLTKETTDDTTDIDGTKCSQIVKVSNIDTDDVEECNHLYKQLSKHRNRILSTVKAEPISTANLPIVKTSVIDTGTVKEEDSGLQINATSQFIHAVKPKDEVEEKATTKPNASSSNAPKAPMEDDVEEPIDYAEADVDNNAPMSMGIAEALAYLKDKGDIIEEKKGLSDVGKDINLQYIDEYGRRMTPKEAFRKISWRFHGKGPGMNKQERKIKRIERERLAKQSPLEGLPTIKALLTHQKEAKTSHLVLSGNSTIV